MKNRTSTKATNIIYINTPWYPELTLLKKFCNPPPVQRTYRNDFGYFGYRTPI